METTNFLTEEDISSILSKKLGSNSFKILDTKYAPLSEKIEGFLGEHYILHLKFLLENQEKEESFFIKSVPRNNPSQRDLLRHVGFWEKEAYMYEEVFAKLDEAGYDMSFVPKCYLVKDEIMVMENLRERGFGMANGFLDYEQTKAALEALAFFHANCICFEENKSRELGRQFRFNDSREGTEGFKEIFFTFKDPEGFSEKYHLCGKKCIAGLAKHFPWSPERQQAFADKVLNFSYWQLYETELPFRKTCSHGDLWTNNLLFNKDDSKISCILIDYQITRYSHPSIDALLLLYTSTSRSFRKIHKDELLNYHYDKMNEIVASHGLTFSSILTKPDYLYSAKLFEPLACFQATRNKTLTHLPLEVINKIVSNGIDFQELVFSDIRVKMVSEAFQNNENFRGLLTDDINDIEELF